MTTLAKLIPQLGALELGIIPMQKGTCIDSALKDMSPEESKKVRRKYRKLKRRAIKEDPTIAGLPRLQRKRVYDYCVAHGRKLLDDD